MAKRRAQLSAPKPTRDPGVCTLCWNMWRAVGWLPSCAGEAQVHIQAKCFGLNLVTPLSPWATAQHLEAMQIPPFSVSSGTEKEEFSAEEGGGGQVKGKRFNTLISITEKKKSKT